MSHNLFSSTLCRKNLRSFALLFFLLSSLSVFPATIYVWLQGFEVMKGGGTWDVYKQHITPTNGYVVEYTLNNSIPNIAANLYNNKIKPIEGENDIVLIGHGMGGLIARSIQLLSPNVKGIITIGTAHAGSTLLKNTLRGDTYDFFSMAIRMIHVAIDKSLMTDVLSRNPVKLITEPIVIPTTIFKSNVVVTTLNELKTNYQTEMGLYAVNRPCVKDLLPNSNYLKMMHATPMHVPLLNIYGSEEYWEVERAMGTMKHISKVNCPQYMDTSYDMEFVAAMQSALGVIDQIQTMHTLVYNALTLPAMHMPWIWQSREFVLDANYQWDYVYRYLAIGMHVDFAINMGALEYRLHNYCVPTMLTVDHISCTQKYLPYVLDNDGIVSSKDVLCPLLSGKNIHNIKIQGLNHLEVGNHVGVRKLLEGIIKLESYGGAFAQ